MRSDRETLAWAITVASFFVLCLISTTAVLAGRWYLLAATDPKQARLQVISGPVQLHEFGKPEWFVAAPQMTVGEGYSVKTDHNSQALITFFDDSTIVVLPDTDLTLSSMRLSSFSLLAPRSGHIRLTQSTGKSVIGVAPFPQGSMRFDIGVPQGLIALSEGSYTLDVSSSQARVRVKDDGRATVTAQNKTVEAVRGQRIDTQTDKPPEPPESASVELISNGNFQKGLEGWTVDNTPGFPEGADVLGTVQLMQASAPSISFVRTGSKGTHNETYIAQDLDADVTDLTKLQLSIEFKLVKQNVSGGGYMGSEYPLLVRVYYRSDQGDSYIIRGFFYQNDSNNRTDNGAQVAHDTWITWTMPENLMQTLVPIPRKITRIELGGSGHDYTSEVRSVSLSGE